MGMPIPGSFGPAVTAEQMVWEPRRPGFLDRFTTDMVGTIKGMPGGIFELGKAGVNDLKVGLTGEGAFRSDDIASQMWDSFANESWLSAAATARPIEAWNRFSERPFTGLLDAAALVPVVGWGAKGATTLGKAGMAGSLSDPLARAGLKFRGFKELDTPIGPVMGTSGMGPTLTFKGVDGPVDLPRSEYANGFAKSEWLNDDSQWLRRTHRTLLPSRRPMGDALPEELDLQNEGVDAIAARGNGLSMPRSVNEPFAKIGDAVAGAMEQRFPETMGFLSNTNRYVRKLQRKVMGESRASAGQAELTFTRKQKASIAAIALEKGIPEEQVAETFGQLLYGHAAGYGDADLGTVDADRMYEGSKELDPDNDLLDVSDEDFQLPAEEFMRKHRILIEPKVYDERAAMPYQYGTIGDFFERIKGDGKLDEYQATQVSDRYMNTRDNHRDSTQGLADRLDLLMDAYRSSPSKRATFQPVFMGSDGKSYNRIEDMPGNLDTAKFVRQWQRKTADFKLVKKSDLDLDEHLDPARIRAEHLAKVSRRDEPVAASQWPGPDTRPAQPEDRVFLDENGNPMTEPTPEQRADELAAADLADRLAEVQAAMRGMKDADVDLLDPDIKSKAAQVINDRNAFWAQQEHRDLIRGLSDVGMNRYVKKELKSNSRHRLDLDALINGRERRTATEKIEDPELGTIELEDENALRVSGLVRLAAEIKGNPLLNVVGADPRFIEFLNFIKDDVLSKTEAAAREWNVDDMNGKYAPEHYERTAKRLALMTGGDENAGFYLPIRGKKPEPDPVTGKVPRTPGKRQEAELSLDRDDVGAGKGDAMGKLISGNFRIDPEVFLDNQLYNIQHLYHSRMTDGLEGASMWMGLQRHKELEEQGLVGWSDDYEKMGTKPLYVAIKINDPTTQMMLNLNQAMKEAAQEFDDAGRHMEAENLRESMRQVGGDDLDKLQRGIGLKEAAGNRKRAVTANLDRDPQVMVVNTEFYEAWRREAAASTGMLRAFSKKSGGLWKTMVLHGRFLGWMRNNLIGSALMLMASGGLLDFAPAMQRVSKRLGPVTKGELKYRDDLIENLPRVVSGSGSSEVMKLPEDTLPFGASKPANFLRELVAKGSDFNTKIADEPFRLARADQILRRQARELKPELERAGMAYDEDAVIKTLLQDMDVKARVTEEVLGDMVDFSDLGKFERDFLASVFPFWAWMKGSTKASGRMMMNQPENVWAMGMIGDLGAETTQEQMGDAVPEFARSLILPDGDKDGIAINTSGMIPWEQPTDLLAMALGAVPGGLSYRQFGQENLLSNMHPFIGGTAAAVTGKDPFFGTPIKNEAWGTTFLKRQLALPLVDMLNPNSKMYRNTSRSTRERDALTAWANWAGLTYQDPKWGAIHGRSADELQERYGSTGPGARLAEIAS